MTTELLEARASRALRDAVRPLSWWQAIGPLLAWAIFFGVMMVGGLVAESPRQGQRPEVAESLDEKSSPAAVRRSYWPDQRAIRASFAP